MNWGPPTNSIEVRSFLGLAGYYQRFVENFSIIASLMTKLLRNNIQFGWTDECQNSFDELKKWLTIAPVLTFPSSGGGYVIYSDAFYKSLDCVLM